MKKSYSRREFIKRNSFTGLGVLMAGTFGSRIFASSGSSQNTLAILGGQPAHPGKWVSWPIWKPETDEEQLLKVIRSGVWSRANTVDEFERKWAQMIGSKRCLSVVNGTNALIVALTQMGVGAGDEIIVPPYTFIATVAAVLMTGAIPVFADIDPETYQIDPEKIEKKINARTRVILPVHILGLPADMIRIMSIAGKHRLLVLEDACQAWLAEINHKKTGTFGKAGCFSFQNSKNLAIGEGGAIVSDDDEFMDRCCSYNNFGFPHNAPGSIGTDAVMLGTKVRFTEYQAAIGLAEMVRLEGETKLRNENAAYLRAKIEKIPGIIPYKLYNNVTQAAFHLFPFRYKKEQFKGISRNTFLRTLRAEGVPCSGGYTPLNKMPFLEHAFNTKNFRKMYTAGELDAKSYYRQNECPENDLLCTEAVWLPQSLLLGNKQDMDDIANAIEKISQNAGKLISYDK
ncbi:MAG: DegT/DnrJ/EryC1/StrS family aminotransferase [Bacteroidales bacterium]|jgi:dTDP-4-amino-4,6-dideoxygalactose transaminase|nr:DegT/DnrJ/EryC1/StrS family aminotransferase [Bacteroidales bacterium]